ARVLGSHAREEECLAFLNFGSAGHPHRAVGEVLLAHEVRDGGSGRKWFPPFCFALPCATDRVTTVDRIERAYGEETLYEMEASGFVETAQRFTTSELVHCVKFVSDNAEQRVEDLDLPRVGELAEASLDTLLELVGQVRALARTVEKSHSLPEVPDGLWQRWHFTVTQERQRHRLLSRWRALQPEQPLPEDLFSGARSSREALAVLEKAVEAAARR
ncbi:MAG: hypothetical protein KDD47_25400, partial [Acidobacteria bacterium]|nr:hypothetical protein [Acidobacteriota bacterium]